MSYEENGWLWPLSELRPVRCEIAPETLQALFLEALEDEASAKPGKDLRVVRVFRRGTQLHVYAEEA